MPSRTSNHAGSRVWTPIVVQAPQRQSILIFAAGVFQCEELVVLKGGVRLSWWVLWRSPYEGLNVGDSRTFSERVVALLIAHMTVSPDF